MARNGKNISFLSAISLLRFLGVIFVILLMPYNLFAQQVDTSAKFAENAKVKDSLLKNESNDTLTKADSTKTAENLSSLGIRISPDALEELVEASAKDSAVMDIKTNNFRLYGDAKVDYDGMKLGADQIDFDQLASIATATEIKDSTNKKPITPTFEKGSEKFTYQHLQYNFKSQRAIVRNARSQYGEGFMQSQQVKRNADQSLYGYKNVYTTCALEHPHFGIRTNRIKIIPEQAIAMGSANIEIEGVPTPVFLPFGYFPVNNESHRSGFILPTYTVEQNRGLGLLRGGYYFYLNDYVDFQVQTDIYTKGSFAGYLSSNYINKYRYNGNVGLSYSINKTGEEFDPSSSISKSFLANWSHFKDAKSLPGITFNANVNVQTGNFYAQNSYDPNQIVQNQFQSNITFGKVWAGTPFSLTASALHNQNTTTKQMNVTLPDITFFINPQTPFARKVPVGATKWYEKITVGYTMHTVNRLSFYDTAFQLNTLKFKDFQNGISHNIPISANYNILRFVTLSVNAAYNEYWNPQKTFREYNDNTDKIDTTIDRGFAASRDFNAGFSLNTQIYGMKMFKKGTIRGIRHVVRPSVGMSFRPDFAKDPFNFYYQSRLDTSQQLSTLSYFDQSIIGIPPQGRNGSVNFGLNNNLQMKVRNGKDTVTGFKNIVLLDRLDFNTSYNVAADSFQWSNYIFTASTTIANLLNINANANFDPYQYDYVAMRRTPRTTLATDNKFARLSSAQLGFSTSLRSKQKNTTRDENANTKSDDFKGLMRNNGYHNYIDFNIPWTLSLNYSFNLNRQPSRFSQSDSSIITQSVTVSGDFNFTPRWKMAVSTGYNLVEKQITFSKIDIYRDLHCWEMRLGFIPFGTLKRFEFSLNVKAQVLQDLKLTRRRDFRDAVN